MRFVLAVVCMSACATSALAQYGVSNARDAYGNLMRNTRMNPAQNPQGRVNNEPIKRRPVSAPSPNLGVSNAK
jgi:hypothetical protein